ncbi:unnamed protein product, partial [Nesidiocoris tenuis]
RFEPSEGVPNRGAPNSTTGMRASCIVPTAAGRRTSCTALSRLGGFVVQERAALSPSGAGSALLVTLAKSSNRRPQKIRLLNLSDRP